MAEYTHKPLAEVDTVKKAALTDADTVLIKNDGTIKQTLMSNIQNTYTEGNNIQINNNVISATDTTYSAATTSTAGLMSAEDKTKLDGVQSDATATSVSSTGTATDEISYITVNGVEKKIAGGLPTTATAGDAMVYDGSSWAKQDGYGYTTIDEYTINDTETINNFTTSGSIRYADLAADYKLDDLKTYLLDGEHVDNEIIVYFDGIQYSCTVTELRVYEMGWRVYVGDSNFTNAPFYIEGYNSSSSATEFTQYACRVPTTDTATSHDIKVTENASTVHQIDSKYIDYVLNVYFYPEMSELNGTMYHGTLTESYENITAAYNAGKRVICCGAIYDGVQFVGQSYNNSKNYAIIITHDTGNWWYYSSTELATVESVSSKYTYDVDPDPLPDAEATDGGIHIIYLTSEPTTYTRYAGYIYMIAES